MRKIPRVNIPSNDGMYKFVYFEVEEKPYVRFGVFPETRERRGDLHLRVLERFVEEFGLKPVEKMLGGQELPFPPDDSRIILVSAGLAQVERKAICFGWRSGDYSGYTPRANHVERFRDIFPGLALSFDDSLSPP